MRLWPLLCCLFFALPAWADRVALVIGNGAYRHEAPLKNAANDARDLADKLRQMDFQVFEGVNQTRADTLRLVQDFRRAIKYDDTALFYFAGHGIQLGGDNYILPIDAYPGNEAELTETSIKLQSILQTMENAADTRIVILDACRNNPFLRDSSNRSTAPNRGLMRMEAGVGSFIAFSTEPGNVAADGAGRNSPFTEALLRHIDEPGANIHAVMRAVRSDVRDVSNGTQIPWENSSLIDEIYLAGLPHSTPAPATATAIKRHMPRPSVPGETCIAQFMNGGDVRFCVDSVLDPQSGNKYGPGNLFDSRPDTAWVEGVRGNGEGQHLSFEFLAPRDFSTIHLMNGYAKSERTFTRNARVKTLKISGSSGAETVLVLQDHPNWQSFSLPGLSGQHWVQLEILSTYPGTHYQDTAITALEFD